MLNKQAKKQLESLLVMFLENFKEMSLRWEDFTESKFNIKNSKDFQIGYMFGKIEHKFIEWFYSTNARSLTDNEYKEFWKIVMKWIKDTRGIIR